MRGIVYVVWGDERWLHEAIKSAASTQLPTCLLTESRFVDCHFTYTKVVDFSRFDGMDKFMKKWICLTETPFDSTLFLDTDTVISGSLDLGFELAEQFGLCTTLSPGMIFHYKDREYIHYNGGVLFFTGHRPTELNAFCTAAKRLEGSGLVGDEPAISLAFRELAVNPCVLPSVFNTIRAGRTHTRQIKIYHSRFQAAAHLVSDQFGNDFTQ